MRKIILAVDGSKHSDQAAHFLSRLPHREPIEIVVLSVAELPYLQSDVPTGNWIPELLARAKAAAVEPAAPAPAMDDTTKGHIRNLDVGIKRLIDEQARSSEALSEDLRSELKLLARTISAGLDANRSNDGSGGGGGGTLS